MAEPRVNEEELEYDDDQRIHRGQPFNGIGFLIYPNGQLRSEALYRDGFKEGIVRDWHANGQLMEEWIAKHGQATGEIREWHANGQLRAVRLVEFGAQIERREWDEQGKLLSYEHINPASAHYQYVLKMRGNEGKGIHN
jgi:antitoxin component YwqK of YwqJK toxin-antitoxin module